MYKLSAINNLESKTAGTVDTKSTEKVASFIGNGL
jgi:hypothetical protein